MLSAYPSPVKYIGCDAADAVQELILSFKEIASVTFASYSHLPMVQERAQLSEVERSIVKKAINRRSSTRLPFWDCVMLAISKSEKPANTLLDTAATHVSLRGLDTMFNRDALMSGRLRELIQKNSLAHAETCVVSEVVLSNGAIQHLPMIDFHCAPTLAGKAAATAVCRRIFPKGAILVQSGESFHAYGRELLSVSQFYQFLGRALLYSPIIDRAYIAHQLIEGRCALRISSVSKAKPVTVDLI